MGSKRFRFTARAKCVNIYPYPKFEFFNCNNLHQSYTYWCTSVGLKCWKSAKNNPVYLNLRHTSAKINNFHFFLKKNSSFRPNLKNKSCTFLKILTHCVTRKDWRSLIFIIKVTRNIYSYFLSYLWRIIIHLNFVSNFKFSFFRVVCLVFFAHKML